MSYYSCFLESAVELGAKRLLLGSANPFPMFIGTAKQIGEQTASQLTFDTIRFWIDHCIGSHDSCQSGAETPLPSRVLDLGEEGKPTTSTTDAIQLYLTCNEPASYVCLSYCWGHSQTVKTTRGTIEQHRRGILVSTLPKTVRDAIAVTRRLGIRYLWIDSLCIIQDDESNWSRESSQMADIYNKAVVTIAASKSLDGQDGLYSRASSRHVGQRLSFTDEQSNTYEVYAREPLSHLSGWFDDLGAENHPLLHCAWAFQERLLSQRVVHFNNNEVVMECMNEYVCQCSANMRTDSLPKTFFSRAMRGDAHSLLDEWSRLVEQYSGLDLTFPSDKLPALFGIAKIISQNHDDTYLAGLWKSQLPGNLAWHRNLETPAKPKPAEWRAPSWSWASSDSHVVLPVDSKIFTFEPFIDVLDANCESVAGSPGQVRSGRGSSPSPASCRTSM